MQGALGAPGTRCAKLPLILNSIKDVTIVVGDIVVMRERESKRT